MSKGLFSIFSLPITALPTIPSLDRMAISSPAFNSLRYLVVPSAIRAYEWIEPALTLNGLVGINSVGIVSPWTIQSILEIDPVAIP